MNTSQSDRLVFIDNVRIFLMFNVVLHHVISLFRPYADWYWLIPTRNNLFERVFFGVYPTFNCVWNMFCFFLITASFIPGSYDRKGPKKYLSDRILRLGVPLLLMMLLVYPTIEFFILDDKAIKNAYTYPEYWQKSIYPHQLWFLEYFLAIGAIYVGIQLLMKKLDTQKFKERKVPSIVGVFFFTMIIGLINFTIRIWIPLYDYRYPLGLDELSHASIYISAILVGITAAKNNWLVKYPKKDGYIWAAVGGVSIVIWIVLFAIDANISFLKGGWTIGNFLFSINEAFSAVALTIGLLVIIREKWPTQSPKMKILSDNTYGVYLTHFPIVLLFQKLFYQMPLNHLLLFFIIYVLSLIGSFLASHFILRRIPYLKKII